MNFVSILALGFVLGMKHATEADHLAAVATLATRQSSLPQALRQGLAWGIGHTLTLMALGSVVLALGKAMPPSLTTVLEGAVGVMLIGLGVDVLRRLAQDRTHFHHHRHGSGPMHVHAHVHTAAVIPPAIATPRFSQMTFVPPGDASLAHAHTKSLPLRALAIGMMHGMAGSAALIVLSLQTVQSVPMGMLYIALFGLGSMVGMAVLSAAIAVPLRLSAGRLVMLHKGMTAAVGLLSCALGIWTLYRIGTG